MPSSEFRQRPREPGTGPQSLQGGARPAGTSNVLCEARAERAG